MSILNRIKETASKRGMTISQLADITKISEPTFYRWDKTAPNTAKLELVANELNVSVDYLLGRSDDENTAVFTNLNSDQKDDLISMGRMAIKATPEQREQALNVLRALFDDEED